VKVKAASLYNFRQLTCLKWIRTVLVHTGTTGFGFHQNIDVKLSKPTRLKQLNRMSGNLARSTGTVVAQLRREIREQTPEIQLGRCITHHTCPIDATIAASQGLGIQIARAFKTMLARKIKGLQPRLFYIGLPTKTGLYHSLNASWQQTNTLETVKPHER